MCSICRESLCKGVQPWPVHSVIMKYAGFSLFAVTAKKHHRGVTSLPRLPQRFTIQAETTESRPCDVKCPCEWLWKGQQRCGVDESSVRRCNREVGLMKTRCRLWEVRVYTTCTAFQRPASLMKKTQRRSSEMQNLDERFNTRTVWMQSGMHAVIKTRTEVIWLEKKIVLQTAESFQEVLRARNQRSYWWFKHPGKDSTCSQPSLSGVLVRRLLCLPGGGTPLWIGIQSCSCEDAEIEDRERSGCSVSWGVEVNPSDQSSNFLHPLSSPTPGRRVTVAQGSQHNWVKKKKEHFRKHKKKYTKVQYINHNCLDGRVSLCSEFLRKWALLSKLLPIRNKRKCTGKYIFF